MIIINFDSSNSLLGISSCGWAFIKKKVKERVIKLSKQDQMLILIIKAVFYIALRHKPKLNKFPREHTQS